MSEEQVDSNMKSINDIIVSQVYLVEAILALLEQKGILSMKEVTDKIEEIKKQSSM